MPVRADVVLIRVRSVDALACVVCGLHMQGFTYVRIYDKTVN